MDPSGQQNAQEYHFCTFQAETSNVPTHSNSRPSIAHRYACGETMLFKRKSNFVLVAIVSQPRSTPLLGCCCHAVAGRRHQSTRPLRLLSKRSNRLCTLHNKEKMNTTYMHSSAVITKWRPWSAKPAEKRNTFECVRSWFVPVFHSKDNRPATNPQLLH